jgi:D-aspartate ligase
MGSAISVARSLGQAGVSVFLLDELCRAERYSRYVRHIRLPTGAPPEEAWADYLLGPQSERLRGAVLLACSDAGIEVLLRNRGELSQRYRLDISDLRAQESALNKLQTYVQASEARVPAPRHWQADGLDQIRAARDEFVYPLLLKPFYSHKFSAVYGSKFLEVQSFDQLCSAFANVAHHDLQVVLLEKIPGPDDRLCSYFTYIDEGGSPQFDFTKRVIRRHPENQGLACYHVTDWIPEVADLGRRLLTHVGLQGLGNVEFKRDVRDGQLKVIEINARFTAANPLLVASGYDLGLYVYNRLIGRAQPSLMGKPYPAGLHMWYPANDAKAFLELRREGRLTFPRWVGSLLHRQILPYFRWYDPAPSIVEASGLPRRMVNHATHQLALRRARTSGR